MAASYKQNISTSFQRTNQKQSPLRISVHLSQKRSTILFVIAAKKIGRVAKQKQSKKKRDMDSENSCVEQQSFLYLSQISASSEFVRNMLQKSPVKTNFRTWMNFQTSLSLWELQGIRDILLFVTKIIEKSLKSFIPY